MQHQKTPPEPTHIAGNNRGEQLVLDKGREPGRGKRAQYRGARDSTGVNAEDEEPIDPSMPSIPPA